MPSHKNLTGIELHNSRINLIHGDPNILHTPSTYSGECVIDLDTNSLYTSNVTGNSSTGYIVTWHTLTSSSPKMATLTDVDLTGLTDKNILRYNSSTQKWEVSTDITSLANLTDVHIPGIVNGEIIRYNTSTGKFLRSTDITSLSKLTDVNVSTIANGDVLVYNSSTGKYYPGDGPSTKRNNVDNSGTYTAPSYVDNGNGSVTIGVGVYNLYHTLDFSGNIYQHTIDGNTFILENYKTNYILANYNNGNPIVYATTTPPLPYSTLAPVYTLYRNNDELYKLDWDEVGKGYINKLAYQDLKIKRFHVEPDCLNLTTSTGNSIVISSGTVWRGGVPVATPPYDSNVNTLDYYYHSGGLWVETENFPSTSTGDYVTKYYDDGNNLVELSSDDHCAINWVYRSIESSENCAIVVLGKRDYTLSRTQISQPIKPLPDFLENFCVLVGRIIVRKDNSMTPIVDNINDPLFFSQSFVENVDAINVEAAERNSTGLISGGVLSYNSGHSFAISAGGFSTPPHSS